MPGWRRTFWVVFIANLISGAGLMSFLPFFPSLLESLGVADERARAAWSGVLFGAAPLTAAIMGPMWGSIGDRFGRKLMVVRSMIGLAAFVGAMAWARSPWELLALRIGQGIFSGYIPPSLTLVSIATPRELQGRVTGGLQVAGTVGMIAGPLFGALVLSTGGPDAVFVSVAIAAGTGAALVGFFAREDPGLRASAPPFALRSLLAAAWSDLAALAAIPRLRSTLAIYAALWFGLGATNPLLELFVEGLWAGDPARVEGLTGTLFSALAVTAIVATPLWGSFGDRAGHGIVLRTSTLLSALTLVLHALAPAYGWLLAARIALGLASPGANTAAFGIAATETPAEQRGAAMGAVFSARAIAASLGSMGGGALASALGIRGLFAAAGVAIALSLVAVRRG